MSGADLPTSLGSPPEPQDPRRTTPPGDARDAHDEAPLGRLARAAAATTAWAERWVPDAYVFALVATVVVVVLGVVVGKATPSAVVTAWGSGFWDLLPFTLQMALVIITGYVI